MCIRDRQCPLYIRVSLISVAKEIYNCKPACKVSRFCVCVCVCVVCVDISHREQPVNRFYVAVYLYVIKRCTQLKQLQFLITRFQVSKSFKMLIIDIITL